METDSNRNGVQERVASVGILGAGQLGQMIYLASIPLNLHGKFSFLDPNIETSSIFALTNQQRNDRLYNGDFKDKQTVLNFISSIKSKNGNRKTVLSIEIEHVSIEALEYFEQNAHENVVVIPSATALKNIKDKFIQKQCLQKFNKNLVGDFIAIDTFKIEEILQKVSALGGFPIMMKARKEGYDGNGNFVLHCKEDIIRVLNGFKNLTNESLYLEKWIPFKAEISVIIARDMFGNNIDYPIVETFQQDNMCSLVMSPPSFRLSSKVKEIIVHVARDAVAALHNGKEGLGIFAVEMFLLENESVLVNEIAPRVHNSGHITQNLNMTSQFENCSRILTGLPLANPSLIDSNIHGAMVNILGQNTDAEMANLLDELNSFAWCKVHWYGKSPNKLKRKMGHLNILANSRNEVLARLKVLSNIKGMKESLLPTIQRLENAFSTGNYDSVDVAVVMGSDSDLPCMKDALEILDEFHVPYLVDIVSAHRTPDYMFAFAKNAKLKGIKVIIAGAGGAAHLPGMVAALTDLPVIGVPVKSSTLSGVDSLYSIVQMPKGIPVATVAIGNAANAGLLAIKILETGNNNGRYKTSVEEFQSHQRRVVEIKGAYLRKIGWERYISEGGVNNYYAYVDYAVEHSSDEIIELVDLSRFSSSASLKVYKGKVRDCVFGKNKSVIVSSDRISGFDRHLGVIPFKGEVLNLISKYWFHKTQDIVPNHLLEDNNDKDLNEHPNIVVGRRLEIFPIEFVVRGYLTGSTSTSIFTAYKEFFGNNNDLNQDKVLHYCGHAIKAGKKKNQMLDQVIVTPTTKSDIHDELISKEEIIDRKIMSKVDYEYCELKAIEVFKFTQAECARKNLIFVDTKYEFGFYKLSDGSKKIILADEINTPDSSRYWKADSYKKQFDAGLEPESFDKEFFRLWFKAHCDPYKDEILPRAPDDLVKKLSLKYIEMYETITGKKFQFRFSTDIITKKQQIQNLLTKFRD